MIRKLIIVVLTVGAAVILVPGVASFWQPINIISDASRIAWLRMSFSHGDMQLVAIAPNEQDHPTPDEGVYKCDLLDFHLHLRGFRGDNLVIRVDPRSSPTGVPLGVMDQVKPSRDVVRFPAVAFWTFPVSNTSSFDWTDPMTVEFTIRYPWLGAPGGRTVRVVALVVPCWPPLLLLAAYPAIAFVRGPLRRRRRRKRGLCLKCGYDLRGSPGPRCPECGTEVPAP